MSACRGCKKRIRRGNICQACARRSVLAGKRASVSVERNGAAIRIEDVPASQSAEVLADLLSVFRELTQHYDELVQELGTVPGGSPVDGDASDYGAKRRVGFTR